MSSTDSDGFVPTPAQEVALALGALWTMPGSLWTGAVVRDASAPPRPGERRPAPPRPALPRAAGAARLGLVPAPTGAEG